MIGVERIRQQTRHHSARYRAPASQRAVPVVHYLADDHTLDDLLPH